MSWIILGIIFLVITYWILKGSVIEEYSGKIKVEEGYIPRWFLLLLGVIYITPIIGICIFIGAIIAIIIYAAKVPNRHKYRTILKLRDGSILQKISRGISNFLTKHI